MKFMRRRTDRLETTPTPSSARECAEVLALFAKLGDNATLSDEAEQRAATRAAAMLGLPSHHDAQKNWDTLKCLSAILAHCSISDRILDVGASRRSVILTWLHRLGFAALHACDLRDGSDAFVGTGISFSVQDLSATNYPDGHFAAVTSISVIEHGVDLDAYLREMARVIRPGGWLLTSTDYWSEPIDCSGIFPYGEDQPEMKVFQPHEIEGLCKRAEEVGFRLVTPLGLTTHERAVRWERVDREYTFIYFALRRD